MYDVRYPKKITMYDVRNPDSGLRKAQKCGSAKPVNGIPNPPFLITESLTILETFFR
jgi:hypothetical protein